MSASPATLPSGFGGFTADAANALAGNAPSRGEAKQRFHGLDGLRGICAILVVLFHCQDVFYKGTLFAHGFLSVDMFFILSGFVISLTYESRLVEGGGLKAFVRARARRLFPTYWIGTLLCTGAFWFVVLTRPVVFFHGGFFDLVTISLATFFLIPNVLSATPLLYPTNPVAWSLFAEWVANLIYGARLYRLSNWGLAAVVTIGWGAMSIIGFYTSAGWCVGNTLGQLPLAVLRAIPAFFMGVLVYRWHAAGLLERLPKISVEWMFLVWIALMAIPTPGGTPIVDALTVIVAAPMLIALLIRAESTAPRYCEPLGAISYPLYSVHVTFMLLAEETPLFGVNRHPNVLGGIALVGVSIAAAWIMVKLTTPKKRQLLQQGEAWALNP